ncbi:MAG: phage tail sheath subtilisin-like domain-containing protein, partial [Deltaproteobacteria bacterium]|nr:phage tail sheath subtilisin-like domain-containing protein [Deltaproteobacteria bacterium]
MASGIDGIPSDIRLPFTWTAFDPSQADRGASSMAFNVLLAGQMLPAGEAAPLVPKRITTEAQAIRFFGEGSQLAQMVAAFLKANNMTRLTAIGIHDYAQGTAAIGSVEFSGAVTVATPVCLYIGGERVRAGTSLGQTAAAVAAGLIQAVNANPGLAVSAAVDPEAAGKVILTARHKGELGNDIDLRLGYGDEDFPDGLQAEIVPMSGGAGNPDAAEVVASMGGERYHVIALPWHDTASLDAFRDELDSRWGPLRQIDGQAVLVKTGTFAEVCTFAHARNDRHLTVIPSEGSPTLPWKDCAACVGVIAYHGSDDPARPFQTLTVPGVLAPAVEDRWS